MAASPSRLKDLVVTPKGAAFEAKWSPAVEANVRAYLVSYGPANDPAHKTVRVSAPVATLSDAKPGNVVSVKAVNAGGFESWDFARHPSSDEFAEAPAVPRNRTRIRRFRR